MRLLLFTSILCLGLFGCGQSGPLYIPQNEPVAEPVQTPEDIPVTVTTTTTTTE